MTPDDLIYLAYPLDRAGDAPGEALIQLRHWVTEARNWLTADKQPFYDPGAGITNWPGYRAAAATRAINQTACGRASGLLALLPAEIPSIGVPIEIERAWYNRKPVAVVHDGEPPVMLVRDGIEMFSNVEDAVSWLLDQDNGNVENPHRLMAVQRLDTNGQLPVRMFDGDAGFDLMVSQDTEIQLGTFVDVPCGIAIQLPPATWGLIIGRSSTLRKRDLLVTPGVIDGGYRGALFAGCYAPIRRVRVEAGDRLAQFIPFHCVADTLQPGWVADLAPSDRGQRGFGSSGT